MIPPGRRLTSPRPRPSLEIVISTSRVHFTSTRRAQPRWRAWGDRSAVGICQGPGFHCLGSGQGSSLASGRVSHGKTCSVAVLNAPLPSPQQSDAPSPKTVEIAIILHRDHRPQKKRLSLPAPSNASSARRQHAWLSRGLRRAYLAGTSCLPVSVAVRHVWATQSNYLPPLARQFCAEVLHPM